MKELNQLLSITYIAKLSLNCFSSVQTLEYSIFLDGAPVKPIKYSETNENEIVSRFIELLNGIHFAI